MFYPSPSLDFQSNLEELLLCVSPKSLPSAGSECPVSAAAFPPSFWKDMPFHPGGPSCVLMQKVVTITESPDAPVWFDLIRGWEGSATLLAGGIHALRVSYTVPGCCWGPVPTGGCELLRFPRNPLLDLYWKPHVGTPWNQNPETKSCQICGKLGFITLLLRPFSSQLQKKKPALFLPFLLTVEWYFSFKWSLCQFLAPGSLLLAVVREGESSSGKCSTAVGSWMK